MEDSNDLTSNSVAKKYAAECDKIYRKLRNEVKMLRCSWKSRDSMWDKRKLSSILTTPVITTGLNHGYRGMEFGGLGRRKHVENVLEHFEKAQNSTKRHARRQRRGGALQNTSESSSLTDRLWAHAIALADQVTVTV